MYVRLRPYFLFVEIATHRVLYCFRVQIIVGNVLMGYYLLEFWNSFRSNG